MRRLIALLMIAVFLSGCTSMDKKKKTTTLHNATYQYENALRWGDYEGATGFINQDEVDFQPPDPDNMKHYRVTSYDVRSSNLSADQTEARIMVEIRYYNENNMREVTITDRQLWKFDESCTCWYLASPLPPFE